MPTSRKRHMVTETEPVQRALEPLRAIGQRVDMGELVILGAQRKLDEVRRSQRDAAERRKLREQFLDLTSRGDVFDLDAAAEVREHGWARD